MRGRRDLRVMGRWACCVTVSKTHAEHLEKLDLVRQEPLLDRQCNIAASLYGYASDAAAVSLEGF